MRCPTCGNESDYIDEYVCSNCGYIIQREPIESIPIFSRKEEKWYKAEKPIKRIYRVITNPARAFWDINNKKKDKGPLLIKVLMSIILGLMAVAIHSHLSPSSYSTYNSTTTTFVAQKAFQGIPVFLLFFIFGLVYYSILFWFYNFAFSLAGNFSVRLDDILRIRYNVIEEGFRVMDVLSGRRLREEMTMQKQGPTMEQLKEKGDMLTKIKQTGKGTMMSYAYAPFILTSLIGAIIAFVALPSVQISSSSSYEAVINAVEEVSSAGAWKIIDGLNLFTLAFWIPITMTIAQRDLANTNTTKLFIGNIIVGIILSYIMYFLRPTLGWNLNIIEALQ